MKAVADIQVEPIGAGVSIRDYVRTAIEILGECGLRTQVHALGTEVEGELDQVMQAIGRIHQALHNTGAKRINTSVKLETRTDKQVSLASDMG